MPISLQSDAILPQGHILVDGQKVASFSTTGGLSATLNQSIVNQIYQIPGAFNFRNKIINGNFDIWQRGTSFPSASSGTYTADRWSPVFDGSVNTRNITRESFTIGQTQVPNEPIYFLRFNQATAGSGATYNVLRQYIESVRTLAGKQATLSFYAKASTPFTLSTVIAQFYGTGGSTDTYTSFINANVTSSWQKFTINYTLPSISGKIIGSAGNDCIYLQFFLPLNTVFTFDIAEVHLEEGPIATPFEQRPIGTELALCQRYYQIPQARYEIASQANVIYFIHQYFVPTSRTPTISSSFPTNISNITSQNCRVAVAGNSSYIHTVHSITAEII